MRTLVTTFALGVCLVAAPAMAEQHPWVPSDVYAGSVYTGSVSTDAAPVGAYGRLRKGDTVEPGWRTARPVKDELHDESCHSSHPVFSCPGAM